MMSLLREGANLTTHGTNTDGRRQQAGRGAHPKETLEAVGTIPFGAAMGNGARGLQCGWHRMGVFPARSCALKSVPVGRRRDWGNLRSPSDDLFRLGSVERARRDFERAAVWTYGPRGKPRRGRQRAILLFGFDADAQLHAHAL